MFLMGHYASFKHSVKNNWKKEEEKMWLIECEGHFTFVFYQATQYVLVLQYYFVQQKQVSVNIEHY